MKETEYFYWRNDQGELERYHVSQFRDFIDGKPRKPNEAKGENPGESIRPERGKETTEAHHPEAVATEAREEGKII